MTNTRNSPATDKALRNIGAAARRLDARFVPPATLKELEASRAWLASIQTEFKTARRAADAALATAQAQIAAVKTAPGSSDGAWKALEEACRRIEQELAKPSGLRARLDEGRRSLLPKIEKIIIEHLNPTVATKGGRFVGSLDPDGLAELHRQAPLWVNAWMGYVYPRLDEDMALLIEDLWHSRHHDLPLPPPTFEPFNMPELQSSPDLPNVEILKEASGGVGGLLRHMRSVMYSVMSMGFMFGINMRPSAGDEELDVWIVLVMIAVVIAAFSFGLLQNSTERARLEERMNEEVQRRGEQAVRESVRVWLDRRQDKIVDDARDQFRQRRQAFTLWYRENVSPALKRRTTESEHRNQQADGARRSLVQLQSRVRDFGAARAAFEELKDSLERSD